ncbi:GNAT family N-acetyltransferase [Halobacillus litoralis]|uniref:GNAT family N-acetyltransferase n=1 Tax=Halobacillus litoralis TaxID=45668 RepID=UPI001CFE6445|nr:GNAT family N-acetyltransferase [Halobacillus litoralis]
MDVVKLEKYLNIKNFLRGKASFIPVFAYSVLDGYITGEVYSDSASLRTVLVKTNSGLFFICGDADNYTFNHWLINEFIKNKSDEQRFTIFTASKEWDALFKSQLKGQAKQLKRYSFEYITVGKQSFTLDHHENYKLKRINSAHIEQSIEFGTSYYEEYWGSASEFLNNGFGFCMLSNGKVISEGTSIFCSNDFAEIDIATNEIYRGKGLATEISKAFICHSLENAKIPRWDCDVTNTSSIKLAEKLGFSSTSTYSVFI